MVIIKSLSCSFAIQLGYSLSDFKVQGSTVPRAIVQLLKTQGKDKRAPYVILGRFKSMASVGLLDAVPFHMLKYELPKDLRVELKRLNVSSAATLRRNKNLFALYVARVRTQSALTGLDNGDAYVQTLLNAVSLIIK